MNKKQKELNKLMKVYNLDRQAVATLLDVSIDTVAAWFCNEETKRYRNIPKSKLELLNLKLLALKNHH